MENAEDKDPAVVGSIEQQPSSKPRDGNRADINQSGLFKYPFRATNRVFKQALSGRFNSTNEPVGGLRIVLFNKFG